MTYLSLCRVFMMKFQLFENKDDMQRLKYFLLTNFFLLLLKLCWCYGLYAQMQDPTEMSP